MKHNLKVNKTIQYAGIFVLMLALILLSFSAFSPAYAKKSVSAAAMSHYLAAQADPALSDEEKIKAAIDAYFTARYEGQKLVLAQDFSSVIEDDTLDWVKKEKDKREIELYVASLFDLGYESYHFNLDYTSIETKNKKAIVQLIESHEVVFKATAPVVSSMGNLRHVITLHNKKDGWVIYKDEYQDELSQHLESVSKADIKKQVDENYQGVSDSAVSEVEPPVEVSAVRRAYNRQAAVNYANYYSQLYDDSPLSHPNYRVDPNGNDCVNFVSQAINAGLTNAAPETNPAITFMGPLGNYYGFPTGGDANWNKEWYYDFTVIDPALGIEYSASNAWVNVVAQTNFMTSNNKNTAKRKGPAGAVAYNRCLVKAGDVVQIEIDNAQPGYDHEGMIVQVPQATESELAEAAPCTKPREHYLLDAHSNLRHLYSLAYWAPYPMRFVRILGGYRDSGN